MNKIKDFIDKLELEQIASYHSEPQSSGLDERLLRVVLSELGFEVEQNEWQGLAFKYKWMSMYVYTMDLPIVTIGTTLHIYGEWEKLKEYHRAIACIAEGRFKLVKVDIGPFGDDFYITVSARHVDVTSFRCNVKYYLEEIEQAWSLIERCDILRR